jgi:hypothetical protein
VCFQSGSISIVRLGLSILWVWALYMAGSRADVSLPGWKSGSDMVVPVQYVLVSGSDENIVFSESSELYVLALSGRL